MIAVLIESYLDAKNGNPHDIWRKILVVFILLLYQNIGFLIGEPLLGLYYAVSRFSAFDYCYSYFKYGNIFFLGTTSDWDLWLRPIVEKYYFGIQGKYLLLFIRILFILATLTLMYLV